MADIGLFWDREIGAADVGVSGNDLQSDDGLETAVMLSLFCEAADADTPGSGWFGDAVPVVPGDKFGSRLWLLARSKQTPETLAREEELAREALAWLLEDKVAARVDVTAEAVRNGFLGLTVTIHRPKADAVSYRFNYTWAAQEGLVG